MNITSKKYIPFQVLNKLARVIGVASWSSLEDLKGMLIPEYGYLHEITYEDDIHSFIVWFHDHQKSTRVVPLDSIIDTSTPPTQLQLTLC